MDGLFGRVFGSCFRTFWWQEDPVTKNKHIDFIPSRKWRYNDQNLMKELNDHSSWDIMDLTDDEFVNGHIASNGKLQLHDNVFLNPLNTDNNNANRSNPTNNDRQEILRTEHTIVELVAATTSTAPIDQTPNKTFPDGDIDRGSLSTEDSATAQVNCQTQNKDFCEESSSSNSSSSEDNVTSHTTVVHKEEEEDDMAADEVDHLKKTLIVQDDQDDICLNDSIEDDAVLSGTVYT